MPNPIQHITNPYLASHRLLPSRLQTVCSVLISEAARDIKTRFLSLCLIFLKCSVIEQKMTSNICGYLLYSLYTKVEGYSKRYVNIDFMVLGICGTLETFFS